MRVALHATSVVGWPTGAGTYDRGLLGGLAARPDLELSAVPFTARGGNRPTGPPFSVRWRHLPVTARLLEAAWSSTSVPSVDSSPVRPRSSRPRTSWLRRPGGQAPWSPCTAWRFLRHPEWVAPAVLSYRRLVPRAPAPWRGGRMAAGARVLASDIPVHREVSGGHAQLVGPTDVDGRVAALTSAGPLAKPDGSAARAWAGRHSWRLCAEATVEAHRRAIA